MSRVIPKSKIKPAPKRKPAPTKNLDPRDIQHQFEIERLLFETERRRHFGEIAETPTPTLTTKQRLLLVGLTMGALVGLVAEYPRRHTIDFEGIVRARFLDGVREVQHKEREAGLKGGLAELSEADCRMTLEMPT